MMDVKYNRWDRFSLKKIKIRDIFLFFNFDEIFESCSYII